MKDHLPSPGLGSLGTNPSSSASTLVRSSRAGGTCNLGKAHIFPCFCHAAACPLSASAPHCVLGVLIITAAGQELPFHSLCVPCAVWHVMGPGAVPVGQSDWGIGMLPFASWLSCRDRRLLVFPEKEHLFL